MKSMIRKVKAVSLALLMSLVLCGIAMPVANANAETITSAQRSAQVTYLSGELKGNGSLSKSFWTDAPLPVKVVFSSASQVGNQPAPVTVYIDGVTVGDTKESNVKSVIWNLTAGSHTLKVVNGGVWSSFAVDIVTIY